MPVKSIHIVFFILLSLIHPPTIAMNQWVKVIDQDNQPVINAIVSFAFDGSVEQVEADKNIIRQINMHFSPKVLIIKKGESVYFPNEDKTRHHVYSFSKPKPFEIKLYKGLPSEPLVFDNPGLVTLGCNIHDSMVGYIYITDKEIAQVTDVRGMSTFADLSSRVVSVWHPDNLASGNKSQVELLPSSKDNTWLAKITLRKTTPESGNTFKSRFGR